MPKKRRYQLKGMQKYFTFIKKFFDFFRRHGDDDRSLMEKLRDKYRLVVMNDETFERSGFGRVVIQPHCQARFRH